MSIRNMHHMLTALRSRVFVDNLCMHLAASLDELKRRAAKFMQLEEVREFHNQARAEASGEKGNKEKERQGQSALIREIGTKIIGEALSAKLIPPPRKASSPEKCRPYS